MFVPFLYEIFPKSLTQSFCLLQVFRLHSFVFDEINCWCQREFSPAVTVLYVYMDWLVFF